MLLDRTGSMAPLWKEAVQAVNTYVRELGRDGEERRVTLAVCDSHDGFQFDVLRQGVPAWQWRPFGEEEVTPRGMTPLFDALQRIVAMAEARGTDRTVIVVMTDGHENASFEVTWGGAKAALDRARARGWQVVFLGANFDAFDQAAQVGVGAAQTIAAAPGLLVPALRATARESSRYAQTGAPMVYADEDRQAAGEARVLRRRSVWRSASEWSRLRRTRICSNCPDAIRGSSSSGTPRGISW